MAALGSDELGLDPMGVNETDSFIALKPREQWRKAEKEWVVDQIRAIGEAIRHQLRLHAADRHAGSEIISGVRGDLAVKIFGPDSGSSMHWPAGRGDGARCRGQRGRRGGGEPGLPVSEGRHGPARRGSRGISVAAIQDDLRVLVEGRHRRRAGGGPPAPLLCAAPAPAALARAVPAGRLPMSGGPAIRRLARHPAGGEGPLKVSAKAPRVCGGARERPRARPGRLCRRGAAEHRIAGRAARRLSSHMGRAVRKPAAHRRPARRRGARRARPDLPAPVLQRSDRCARRCWCSRTFPSR